MQQNNIAITHNDYKIYERETLCLFIFLAIAIRISYWMYTGRIWEDALITLTPAKNVWDGIGLTHHASEPYVHSFTSPISVLVPLLGESFGHGLFLLKVVSLVAAGFAIFYAQQICRIMNLGLAAQIFVLSFLSFDHLHIFFGMTGMETQIAVATLLAALSFLLASRWTALGITLGLCMWCRPDFAIPCAIVGIWLTFTRPIIMLKVTAIAASVYAPWLIFATLYYGSPIPNTIVAKSLSGRLGPLATPPSVAFDFLLSSWRNFAPFLEYFASRTTIATPFFLVVLCGLLLGSIGTFYGSVRNRRFIVLPLIVAAYMIYRAFGVTNSYYMWYIPPFTAVFSICIGAGINLIAQASQRTALSLAAAMSIAYIAPLPVMFHFDRIVQTDIEYGVRTKVGQSLNELMGPTDTVVLEPLGYLGFYARNKTIYDIPGLGSKVSVAAVKTLPIADVSGLVSVLLPSYAVLRPFEAEELAKRYPAIAERYQAVRTFETNSETRGNLQLGPLSYWHRGDMKFVIYKREDN